MSPLNYTYQCHFRSFPSTGKEANGDRNLYLTIGKILFQQSGAFQPANTVKLASGGLVLYLPGENHFCYI